MTARLSEEAKSQARGDVLMALMVTEWAADASKIRAVVMPVIYNLMAERDDAAWKEAIAVATRQTDLTDLTDLVHFERPSDFRKGVLTVITALNAAREKAS